MARIIKVKLEAVPSAGNPPDSAAKAVLGIWKDRYPNMTDLQIGKKIRKDAWKRRARRHVTCCR